MRFYRLVFLFSFSLALTPPALADSQLLPQSSQPLKVTDLFWKNVGDTFSGPNLLLHAAGVASTVVIVESGLDARVHEDFKDHHFGTSFPGVILGSGLVTGGLATHLYFRGKSRQDQKTLGAAFVLVHATVIQFTYIHTLKALTGRPNPKNESSVPIREQSENFRFGFLRGGIFYGWPSGHVSHTVAVTSALAHYYPEKPWLKWVSAGLSTYMIYTVAAADDGQMHWFSEGIAGALMGYAIGSSVGKNFRARVEGTPAKESRFSLLPYGGKGQLGATLVRHF